MSEPTASPNPTTQETLALVLACAVGFAFSVNYTNHAPLVPRLQAQFGFSQALGGLLTTGIFLTHAIMQVPGGHLADQYGGKRVVLAALMLVVLGNAGLALSGSYSVLLYWKTLVGLGTGSCFVGGARYLAHVIPGPRLARAQGLYGASILAGSGFIIFAVPRIAERAGWTGAFWTTAIMALVIVGVWAALAPEPGPRAHPPSRLGELLTHKPLWTLGLVQMASFGLVIVIGSWVTQLLTKNLGLTAKTAGAVGSLVLLLGMISRPLGGALVRRAGVRTVVVGGLLVNAAACALMATFPRSLFVAVTAIVALGMGSGVPYAGIFTRAAALFPGRAGAAMGLVNMLGIVMILLGAPLVGRLVDLTQSFQSSFAALGAFSLVVALVSLGIARERRT